MYDEKQQWQIKITQAGRREKLISPPLSTEEEALTWAIFIFHSFSGFFPEVVKTEGSRESI
jgi:hypothetical protein